MGPVYGFGRITGIPTGRMLTTTSFEETSYEFFIFDLYGLGIDRSWIGKEPRLIFDWQSAVATMNEGVGQRGLLVAKSRAYGKDPIRDMYLTRIELPLEVTLFFAPDEMSWMKLLGLPSRVVGAPFARATFEFCQVTRLDQVDVPDTLGLDVFAFFASRARRIY